ncbi:MAG: glycosyltransferase family 39 protein [Saprospiraceae bacterium]|nr:glycosyltransferase family 39 protein [Saprospiraceae bacterium]
MTSHAPLLRYFPALLFAGLALLSWLLAFNGLYGQDAHEYVRQCRAIVDAWSGGLASAVTLGDSQFAQGYPVAGALLTYLTGDPILGLQIISWVAYAASVFALERLLNLLSHGSRADSRVVFIGLGLALSPVFVKAGFTVMSDSLALAFALGAFYYGLKWLEQHRGRDVRWAAFLTALAVSTRPAMGALIFPMALVIGLQLLERRRWSLFFGALLLAALVLWPQLIRQQGLLSNLGQHSLVQNWSATHFFQRSFSDLNSGNAVYAVPNILYLLFPLFHPGFCLTLAGLWLLAKKTDLALVSKRVIVAGIIVYLLLIGGLPHQNLRYLLPVYALLLLLFFPSWDRMYCYGLYFFKRLTWSIIGVTCLVQLFFSVRTVMPVIQRNHLEKAIAEHVRRHVPSGSVVYGFDMDVAMRTYLPELEWRNMWIERYQQFPPGSFVLFNEALLKAQWAGKNPMLNWADMHTSCRLEEIADENKHLKNGWTLYRFDTLNVKTVEE